MVALYMPPRHRLCRSESCGGRGRGGVEMQVVRRRKAPRSVRVARVLGFDAEHRRRCRCPCTTHQIQPRARADCVRSRRCRDARTCWPLALRYGAQSLQLRSDGETPVIDQQLAYSLGDLHKGAAKISSDVLDSLGVSVYATTKNSTTVYATNGAIRVRCNLLMLTWVECPTFPKMAPETCPQPELAKLQYKKLGDSDILINEITLGTMNFGEQSTEKESYDMLSYSFDQGINILDTAEIVDSQYHFKRFFITFKQWESQQIARANQDFHVSEEDEHPEYIIRGTPGEIQYFGELEDHCYWGNEVKLYECHVDALFTMFWHKKPEINYYVCTINKTFAKPGQRMYFQVHYTEENLLDYIDPHNDTLMVRLANGRLLAECRIMVGTDKRATITTNWSEFRRRANIREGDICAFRFRVTSKRHLVLTVHRL